MEALTVGRPSRLGFVLVTACGGCTTGVVDKADDPGVHYTNQDAAGRRIELILYWDNGRAARVDSG
jgi:hypothetical protein